MEVKSLKTSNPRKATVSRVQAVKSKLPKNFRQIILANYPEYNTATGAVLINNVVALRTAHIELTEILERIASGELKLKNSV